MSPFHPIPWAGEWRQIRHKDFAAQPGQLLLFANAEARWALPVVARHGDYRDEYNEPRSGWHSEGGVAVQLMYYTHYTEIVLPWEV